MSFFSNSIEDAFGPEMAGPDEAEEVHSEIDRSPKGNAGPGQVGPIQAGGDRSAESLSRFERNTYDDGAGLDGLHDLGHVRPTGSPTPAKVWDIIPELLDLSGLNELSDLPTSSEGGLAPIDSGPADGQTGTDGAANGPDPCWPDGLWRRSDDDIIPLERSNRAEARGRATARLKMPKLRAAPAMSAPPPTGSGDGPFEELGPVGPAEPGGPAELGGPTDPVGPAKPVGPAELGGLTVASTPDPHPDPARSGRRGRKHSSQGGSGTQKAGSRGSGQAAKKGFSWNMEITLGRKK